MKNPKSTGGETITELTEATEGDNELEGQRYERVGFLCHCPLKGDPVPSEPSVKGS